MHSVCFVVAFVSIAAAYPHEYDSDNLLVNRVRRQSLNISDSEGRGSWKISGGHQRTTDPFGQSKGTSHVRADASYNFVRSQDGNSGLYGKANYQRNFGETPVRQQYGVGLEYRNNNRGTIGVGVGQQTGKDAFGTWRANNVRADANYDIYRSRDGNTRLTGNAYYQRTSGDIPARRDYGGGVVFTRNF